ncbi:unnamed protein product [Cylicocyclus nassatus]|uniref:BACK domain-containing protein n=1 Tax=Cylicocyclus nassatus TaxID=53992 RepID=A0AA36GLV8_CYLNA|nr:unnamed protein product [Cylicocyclus nassatus]
MQLWEYDCGKPIINASVLCGWNLLFTTWKASQQVRVIQQCVSVVDRHWSVSSKAETRKFDATKLPPLAVSVFVRHYLKGEHVVENLSLRDTAAVVHLAQIIGSSTLLSRICRTLETIAAQSDRDLCLCYVISYACQLPISRQFAIMIRKKFDAIQSTLRKSVEDPEMLVPLLESCDILTSSERNVALFAIDWSFFHKASSQQCLRLLNCVRKSFLSSEDTDKLATYVRLCDNDEICVAWMAYVTNPNSKLCWNTGHIMDKMPRCGAGPYGTQTSPAKGLAPQDRHTIPSVETRRRIQELRRSPSLPPRRDLQWGPQRIRRSTIVKTALTKGFSELRAMFRRNTNK